LSARACPFFTNRPPHGNSRIVELGIHVRARNCDNGFFQKSQPQSTPQNFDAGIFGFIVKDGVTAFKRDLVKGTAVGDTDGVVAFSSQILDGAEQAGINTVT
jgi:hypothetical protein